MTIKIREMLKSDWSSLEFIYNEAIATGIATFESKCPTWETWNTAKYEKCRLVITKNEKVVGFAALTPVSPRQVFAGIMEVSIYLDDDYKGLGLGTKLLAALAKSAEENGIWCLYSCVFQINEASIKLHKKVGFREYGYREKMAKDRFGNWQNTVMLELRNNNL